LTPKLSGLNDLDNVKIEPKGGLMTLFLILAPYGVFTVLMMATSAVISLLVAAASCLAVIAIDLIRRRQIKILGAGSAVVFAGIALYLLLIDASPSGWVVRLAADSGIFLISLGSMVLRRPFTLQYALEAVPAEIAAMPGFLRANYVITAAWTAAMALMAVGNIAMIVVPGLPLWTGLAVAFAARNCAIYFTKWYPEYRRIKDSAPPARALPETR
jgi:hypothetical protein